MNSADRPSQYIATHHLLNVVDAIEYSVWSERYLTEFITLRCNSVTVPGDLHDFITAFTKQAREWLHNKPRAEPAYIWVLEAPPSRGLNLHLLLHVPPNRKDDFSNHLLRRWFKAAGGVWKKSAINSKWIGHPGSEMPLHEYLSKLRGLSLYLLKGADPTACALLGDLHHHYQGVVKGRRISTSESLGQKARCQFPVLKSKHGPVLWWYLFLFSYEQRQLIGDRVPWVPRPTWLGRSLGTALKPSAPSSGR